VASLDSGSLVEVRGQTWLLTRTQRFGPCTVLSLEGRDRDNAMARAQVIAPFDRPRAATAGALTRRRRSVVIARALASIHATNRAEGLWTAASARIDLHAYQLEPALAAIAGATRVLLADGVGLGKTIQAGLLLSELHQRGWIDRALIVCPAGLRDTWRHELRERFGLAAAVLDQSAIAERIATFPPGTNPWLADRFAIASIDFVKREEVLAALASVPIDVLIADEAHHLTPGSDRGAAVAELANRAVWCVLVSATPHSGDRAAFDYLTGIGVLSDDLVVFRRSRREAGLAGARRVRFLDVRPNRDERSLSDAITQYGRAIWTARGTTDHAVRLVAITLARRASSSPVAAERTLRRRLSLLGATAGESSQPRLPWDDEDEDDDDRAGVELAVQGLDSVVEERATLERLIALAAGCGISTKVKRLQRLLQRLHEPVIVFTEYRDTLEMIVAALGDARRVAAMHGAMPRDLRNAVLEAFNGGDVDVLVTTDAAGEGLNLHYRCRLVVDFELPWNPLRLEQRIGRVDRLGQSRVVHAIRFFHGATIEQVVLDRLALRHQRAAEDLERVVSERAVAASVFGGGEVERAEVPAFAGESVATASSEARLAAERRRWLHAPPRARVFAPPRRAGTRRLIVLLRDTLANAHGVTIGDRMRACELTLSRSPRSLREWRAAIESARNRLSSHAPLEHLAGRRAILCRITAIRRQLAREQRREYQRSLFDVRADAIHTEREHRAARLDAALARIALAVDPAADAAHTYTEIVAAWPERRS
jgi:superfamily II DNA or RNA helicase